MPVGAQLPGVRVVEMTNRPPSSVGPSTSSLASASAEIVASLESAGVHVEPEVQPEGPSAVLPALPTEASSGSRETMNASGLTSDQACESLQVKDKLEVITPCRYFLGFPFC